MPQKNHPALSALLWGFLATLAAALCYYCLGHYDHNDHMYATAPVLAQTLRLYVDFAYVQTPLTVLIFAQIFKLTGAVHFYSALRIISLALNLAIAGIGIFLCRRHALHKGFATIIFAGLYLWFHQSEIIGAEIGNYTLALILIVLALASYDRLRGLWWDALLVGLFAGLSLSAKLSSIFVVVAFGLLYLQTRRPFAKAFLYSVGTLIGCLPILYYLIANSQWFLFENIHFHYLSNIYRGLAPIGASRGLAAFSIGSGVFAIGLLVVVSVILWTAYKITLRLWPVGRQVLAVTQFEKDTLVIAAATIIGAVTPGVIFQQYMAAPAFMLFLVLALFLDRLFDRASPEKNLRLRTVSIVAIVLLGAWRIYDLVSETQKRQQDGTYGITAVAAERAKLADVIATMDRKNPGCHGDLVTAAPVPAIGAGVGLAPIDSTGSFAMRLDYIFVDNAPAYRRISDPLQALTPRSLILTGLYEDTAFEPRNDFETVMDNYAAAHHFARIPMGPFMYHTLVLYAPAACT